MNECFLTTFFFLIHRRIAGLELPALDQLVVSAGIHLRLQEVLARPKFRCYVALGEAGEYAPWLHDHAAEVSGELPPGAVAGVAGHSDDDHILGAAHAGRADAIVSGDGHLTARTRAGCGRRRGYRPGGERADNIRGPTRASRPSKDTWQADPARSR